jgi:hypothetical protein
VHAREAIERDGAAAEGDDTAPIQSGPIRVPAMVDPQTPRPPGKEEGAAVFRDSSQAADRNRIRQSDIGRGVDVASLTQKRGMGKGEEREKGRHSLDSCLIEKFVSP